jgi:phosphoglucosamine mutase
MTPELVLRLAQAAAVVLRNGDHPNRVVIGKDTRLSGYLFESALRAGFTAMGTHCLQVGSLPTPAIAFLTRALRADVGVMISASHNPFYDNGIKFFDPSGRKLPDSVELEIERMVFEGEFDLFQPSPEGIGKAFLIEDAGGRYVEFCKHRFPRNLRLSGLRVVLDCANGASYRVAPAVLWELGAEVIAMGDKPNGTNINDGFGSLHPRTLQEKVLETRADVGIALDGDADRIIMCDEHGRILDGDHILAMCAIDMQKQGELRGNGVVATVMSNLGLERVLQGHGMHLARTQVGDRYVLEHMEANGYNIGGEQSGHVILLDHNTTGDGLVTGLRVLAMLASRQRALSELAGVFKPVPQVLHNIPIPVGSDPLSSPTVLEAVAQAEADMAGQGRVLVRKSGTEPKVRVMIEGDSRIRIETLARELCATIRKSAYDA